MRLCIFEFHGDPSGAERGGTRGGAGWELWGAELGGESGSGVGGESGAGNGEH